MLQDSKPLQGLIIAFCLHDPIAIHTNAVLRGGSLPLPQSIPTAIIYSLNMADWEMNFLVHDHRPDLQSRPSSLAPSYFSRSQNVGTHYHDPASSIALLSPHPTGMEEKNAIPPSMGGAGSSPQSKDARIWWSDWWVPEILALVVSIMCLASIILVLRRVDGKPLSDWHSFVQDSVPGGHAMSMAPNSVISFFSTIAKSCLGFTATACISQVKWLHIQNKKRSLTSLQVFDDASRGPLGAVSLFFTPEAASSVAAVGALITLAALVIDPFTQLVITYPLRPVSTGNGIAMLNTTSVYHSGATMERKSLEHLALDYAIPHRTSCLANNKQLGTTFSERLTSTSRCWVPFTMAYMPWTCRTRASAPQTIVHGKDGYRRLQCARCVQTLPTWQPKLVANSLASISQTMAT
jgi:hypothetical protein